MDPRKDPEARRKWYRAWTTIRTIQDQHPLPEHMYRDEYIFEYLAANRVLGRFSREWISYGVVSRRDILRIVDDLMAELKAEESDAY